MILTKSVFCGSERPLRPFLAVSDIYLKFFPLQFAQSAQFGAGLDICIEWRWPLVKIQLHLNAFSLEKKSIFFIYEPGFGTLEK